MFYRILLTAIVISCTFTNDQIHALGDSSARQINQIKDVICVLVMSGMEREDLDVGLLKKLERYNVNVDDLKNETIRQDCIKKVKTEQQNADKQVIEADDSPKIEVTIRRRYNSKEKIPTKQNEKLSKAISEQKKTINENSKQYKTETTTENPSTDTDYNKAIQNPENVMKIMKLYTQLQKNAANVEPLENSSNISAITTENLSAHDNPSFDINNIKENDLVYKKKIEMFNQLIKRNILTLPSAYKNVNLYPGPKFRNDKTLNNYLGLISPEIRPEITTSAPCCQVNNNIYSFNKFPSDVNKDAGKSEGTYSDNNPQKKILYEIPEKVIQEITDKVKNKILNDLKKDNTSEKSRKTDTVAKGPCNDTSKNLNATKESMEHVTMKIATTMLTTDITPSRKNLISRKELYSTNTKAPESKTNNNTMEMLSLIKNAILGELRKNSTATTLEVTTNIPHFISDNFEDSLNPIPLNNLVCFVKSEILKHFTKLSTNTNKDVTKELPNVFENGFNNIPHEYLENLVNDIKYEVLGNLKKESLNLNIHTTTDIIETKTVGNEFPRDALQELISKIQYGMKKDTQILNIENNTKVKSTELKNNLNDVPYDALQELVSRMIREMRENSNIEQQTLSNIETTTNYVDQDTEIIIKNPNDALQEFMTTLIREMKKDRLNSHIETTTYGQDTEVEINSKKIPYEALQELMGRIMHEIRKEQSKMNYEITLNKNAEDTEVSFNKIPFEALQELMNKIKREIIRDLKKENPLSSIPIIPTSTPIFQIDRFKDKLPYNIMKEIMANVKRAVLKTLKTESLYVDENVVNAMFTSEKPEEEVNGIQNDTLLNIITNVKREILKELKYDVTSIETTTNAPVTITMETSTPFIIESVAEEKYTELPPLDKNSKISQNDLQEIVNNLKDSLLKDLKKVIPKQIRRAIKRNPVTIYPNKFYEDFFQKMRMPNIDKNKIIVIERERATTTIKPITSEKTSTKIPKNDLVLEKMLQVLNQLNTLKDTIAKKVTTEKTFETKTKISTDFMKNNVNVPTIANNDEIENPSKSEIMFMKQSPYIDPKVLKRENNNMVVKIVTSRRDPYVKTPFEQPETERRVLIAETYQTNSDSIPPLGVPMLARPNPFHSLVQNQNIIVTTKPEIQPMRYDPSMYNNNKFQLNQMSMYESGKFPPNPLAIYNNEKFQNSAPIYNYDNSAPIYNNEKFQNTAPIYNNEKFQNPASLYNNEKLPNPPSIYNSDKLQNLPPIYNSEKFQNHASVYNTERFQNPASIYNNEKFQNPPSIYNNAKFQNPPSIYNNAKLQNLPSIPIVPQNYKYRPPLSHLDFEEYFANNNHIMGGELLPQKTTGYDSIQQRQDIPAKNDYNQQSQPINKLYTEPRKRVVNQFPNKYLRSDQGLNIQLDFDYPQVQPDPSPSMDRYQQSYRASNNQFQRYQRPKSQGDYRKIDTNKKKYGRARDFQSEFDQGRSNRIGDLMESRERDRKVNSIEKRISKLSRVPKRKQESLKKRPSTYDDTHFKNFLKTQQKVNQMLEKILSTKKAVNSVELLKK